MYTKELTPKMVEIVDVHCAEVRSRSLKGSIHWYHRLPQSIIPSRSSSLALGKWVSSICKAGIFCVWKPHGLYTVDFVSGVSGGLLWKEPVGQEIALAVRVVLVTVVKVLCLVLLLCCSVPAV